MSDTDKNTQEQAPATKAASVSSVGSVTDSLSGFGAALVKAAEAKPADTADPLLSSAFALGWHMQELNAQKPGNADGLGGVSELNDDEPLRLKLTINQLMRDINTLAPEIKTAGLDPLEITEVEKLVDVTAKEDPVLALHDQLLIELTAADPRIGKAYGLGRSLADSCQQPADMDDLRRLLWPYRIANLLRWLDDLASAFPPHAARSVALSLARWRDAIYPPLEPDPSSLVWQWIKARGRPPAAPKPLDTGDTDARTARYALRRQGELWRSLLSGEKQATDMLDIDDFLDAAKEFTKLVAVTTRRAILRMPALALLTLALIGVGIWLITIGSGAHIVAGATSVIAAIGLTWKGLGGVLGQLAGKLQRPLWDTVLDRTIADAITLLPGNAKARGRRKLALALTNPDKNRPTEEELQDRQAAAKKMSVETWWI